MGINLSYVTCMRDENFGLKKPYYMGFRTIWGSTMLGYDCTSVC